MSSIQDAIKLVLVNEDMPPMVAQDTQHNQIDSGFIEYVKQAENGIRKGYQQKSGKWLPYVDPGSKKYAIAYGHRIHKGENFTKGITDAQATSILMHDIEIARQRARKEIDAAYFPSAFDQLSPKQQEMLIDFTFNLGTLESFPKFVRGVMTGDYPTVLREYKRYVNGKELTDRNRRFYERYLADTLTVR